MKHRPTSVSLISWFLIVMSVITIASTAFTYNNPDVIRIMALNPLPLTLQYLLMAFGVTVSVGCAVLMLKARSVGRTVYIGWSIASLLISLLTTPAKAMLIPTIIFFLIITFFLFRPKVNMYFSSDKQELTSDS